MTIRYECAECKSVLKIKDDKAGQDGKCPRCKTAFKIPQPGEPVPQLTADDLVDMPLEVTPRIAAQPAAGRSETSSEFDPLGVLNGNSADDSEKLKPSIADLMQEHQEKQALEKARKVKIKKKQMQQQIANPLFADVETTGTAADAITRTYEKKRAEASDAPPLTRDERRAAENRAALQRFVLQLSAVLLTVGASGYFLLSWAFAGNGPDLMRVTGKITVPREQLTGFTIRFTPIKGIGAPDLLGGPSAGNIGPNGEFTLVYKPGVLGALEGLHQISLQNKFGMEIPLPPEFSQREVTADGDNYFEFNL